MMIWLKNIVILGMTLTNLLGFLPSVFSQESIKIGSMERYPPYSFKGKDGQVIGIDVTIVETVLNELGIRCIHVPRPWLRAELEFDNGDTDMLFVMKLTPDRAEKWSMVGPIRSNRRAYFVRHDSGIQDIKAVKDLKGLTVGVVRGYRYSEEFEKAGYFKKEVVNAIKQNVLKLIAGNVDVTLENVIPFKLQLRRSGGKELVRMLPTIVETSDRYAAFHKDEQGEKLSKMFQEKLDELIANGTIQSIIDTWHE
jgi:polar amino acid transport system substrate-binding protein